MLGFFLNNPVQRGLDRVGEKALNLFVIKNGLRLACQGKFDHGPGCVEHRPLRLQVFGKNDIVDKGFQKREVIDAFS